MNVHVVDTAINMVDIGYCLMVQNFGKTVLAMHST